MEIASTRRPTLRLRRVVGGAVVSLAFVGAAFLLAACQSPTAVLKGRVSFTTPGTPPSNVAVSVWVTPTLGNVTVSMR